MELRPAKEHSKVVSNPSMAHNELALALYKKMGFVIEGTCRHSLLIDGNYVDEYYRGKIL